MEKIKISGKKWIGKGDPVFIIAEAGSNHDGKFLQAKKLIDIAAEAGADAVKFQLFRADKIYPPNCGKIPGKSGEKIDLYKFLQQTELPFQWLSVLKKYAKERGLIFFAAPFDESAADELEKNNIDIYKIASPETTHLPLIKHIAKKQKPIILSTGFSKWGEVEEAIEAIYKEKNKKVILMHCVSSYPAPLEDFNLKIIETLKAAFNIPVGISDHSLDPVIVPRLAAALGADIIEKHFTLNKKLPGPDHHFALNPQELKLLVKEVRKTERWSKRQKDDFLKSKPLYKKILGTGQKTIALSEQEIYPSDKRSIFIVKDLKKGEKLNKNNTIVLRAERYLKPGIHPRFFDLVLGKIVSRPIKKYTGLQWEHLLN